MLREISKLGLPVLLLVALGFYAAYQFVGPPPPSRIRLATGAPDGAYQTFGEDYRKVLNRFGVELELRPSAGSVENLELLRAGEVDVALVQGGVEEGGEDSGLLSLGSVTYEPLWVFLRGAPAYDRIPALAGKRIVGGAPGSGTRAVIEDLLESNGVREDVTLVDLPVGQGAEALLRGEVDALCMIAAADSPRVRSLLASEGVSVMSFARAAAYVRNQRYLSHLRLPEGVIDLVANIPPERVSLLSPTANLVVAESFHPALIDILLQAAAERHGGPGLFQEAGDFPSARFLSFPLSREARRYYDQGPPFLQRFLPFWAATQVDRLKVMLLPLFALLIPLGRAFPPLYRWRVRSRIYRWYKELRAIDPGGHGLTSVALKEAIAEVVRIENEVSEVPAPTSYARELYDLRVHIELVRARLDRRVGDEQDTTG